MSQTTRDLGYGLATQRFRDLAGVLLPAVVEPITPEQLQAQIDAAAQAASAAKAAADNARQMVLNRDPKISTLESEQAALATKQVTLESRAQTLGAAIPASEQVHANLQSQITTLTSQLAALTSRVAVLEGLKVIVGFGQATLSGSLAAGVTQSVVVTLSRDMGSATYSPGYSMTGGTGLLGNLSITGIVSQTSKTVTLQIKNTSLLGLTLTNAVVSVVAAREV